MIQLRTISLSLGTQEIFKNLSLGIGAGQRIGVLGRNGAGKSTLLKAIAGQIPLDGGEIAFEKGKKLAYMPQEIVVLSEKTVFDEAFSVFEQFTILKRRKEELEQTFDASGAQEASLDEYLKVQQELGTFDFSAAQARTERILTGLGFKRSLWQQPVTALSVGWKMRLVLAKLLLEEADFYLFDEPTNHLDLVAQEWFFDFLKNGRFGFLLVTHDRYYLDHGCDAIVELERGKALFFHGNYTQFKSFKEQQQKMVHAAYERQQKEIARKQETIDRFKAKASKARMAQSMIKQLEKIERIEIEPAASTIKLSFPPTARSGMVVLKLENIKHAFDNKAIFETVSAEIQRGEKVGLVAPNGTGKTTLFNLITGKYTLQKGKVSFGHNVFHTVFEQDQMRALTANNTIYEEILSACPTISESVIRSFLGSFLFSGDTIEKKISVLSGGERNRVAMVKVLLQKANLLLLDEPTNHLDLYAKEVLLQALQEYDGTMLLVCHDHDFLNKVATRILELTPTGLYSYPGNYESYLEQKRNQIPVQSQQKVQKVQEKPVLQGKELFTLRKEVTSLESKIEKLETEVSSLNNLFLECSYGTPAYNDAMNKLQTAQKSLEDTMRRWEELQCKL